MSHWTDLHEHALNGSQAFQDAIANLDAGLSITGKKLRDPGSKEWTKTQISTLRRFASAQKLSWSWAGFSMIEIRDRLTGDKVTVCQHSDLAYALSSLFCERMIAIALRMPNGKRTPVAEAPDDDWADLDTSWIDVSGYEPGGQFAA